MLIRAEIDVLSILCFNLVRFKTDSHYSLMLSMCFVLNVPDSALKMIFSIFNESFLCEELEPEEYTDVVASVICVSSNFFNKVCASRKQSEEGESCEEGEEFSRKSEGEKFTLEENWFLKYHFNADNVEKGIRAILKKLGGD